MTTYYALQQVMDDDSFKINTPAIINTRKSAENLMNWCLTTASLCSLESFNKNITEHLQQVILSSTTKSFMYNKEKLWRQFYLLRCSPDFILQWTAFLSECQIPVKPVLYQHLTDIIFKTLLQNHFHILQLETDNSMDSTNNERSALRYASGYICRHLCKKFERENHDLKEEMILCLASLVKDSSSEECGTDEEWLELMDRGGLYHVKETTFQLFCAIEGQVRSLLEALTKPCSSSKLEMIRKVIEDEDVQFYWIISTADFEIDDTETHDLLLYKIVELFITMRGFSKASAWMKKYKQSVKKTTQRSKSLRRDLHDNT